MTASSTATLFNCTVSFEQLGLTMPSLAVRPTVPSTSSRWSAINLARGSLLNMSSITLNSTAQGGNATAIPFVVLQDDATIVLWNVSFEGWSTVFRLIDTQRWSGQVVLSSCNGEGAAMWIDANRSSAPVTYHQLGVARMRNVKVADDCADFLPPHTPSLTNMLSPTASLLLDAREYFFATPSFTESANSLSGASAVVMFVAGISGLSAGSSSDAQGLALLSGAYCSSSAMRSVGGVSRYSLSPFADLGHIWVIAGNILVIGAVVLIHITATLVHYLWLKSPRTSQWTVSLEVTRFPGWSVPVWVLLTPGILRSSVALISLQQSLSAGVTGIVWTVASIVVMCRLQLHASSVLSFVAYKCHIRDLPCGCCSRRWTLPLFVFPRGCWVPLEKRQQFSTVLGATVPPYHHGSQATSMVTLVATIITSIDVSQGSTSCVAQWVILALLYIVSAIVIAALRPYRAPIASLFQCATFAVSGIIAAIGGAMSSQSSNGASMTVAVIALWVSSAALTFVSLAKLLHAVWVMRYESTRTTSDALLLVTVPKLGDGLVSAGGITIGKKDTRDRLAALITLICQRSGESIDRVTQNCVTSK